MNIETIGATRRPKLSLAYGASQGRQRPPAAAAGALPDHELRRIVAGMIG